MKTTLELPDELVKAIKLRAIHDGKKLKDAVADLLRQGLAADTDVEAGNDVAVVLTDPKTGLPIIKCRHTASPDREMTAERIAEILMAQELEWHNDARR